MASRADDFSYLFENETAFKENVVPRSQRLPRIVRTWLTDKEIQACGLEVFDVRPFPANWFQPKDGRKDGVVEQWLVHGPANDDRSDSSNHKWIEIVADRIALLRRIAAEEGQEIDDHSVDAAHAFIKRIPTARQPGTFLIGKNIRFVWDRNDGEQVGLQFIGADRIQYVIFQRDVDNLSSTMGVKSHDAMLRLILGTEICDIIS